jgi:UPF0755 protein
MKFSSFLLVLLLVAGAAGYLLFLAPNVNGKRVAVKIPTGSSYDDVLNILEKNEVLKSKLTFKLVSQIKHYPEHVKSGYYVFNGGMNNRQLVNILALGLQTPVTMVIYNIRTREEFAGLVGRTLEMDSLAAWNKLNDPFFCAQYKLDTNNILSRFIVDNYEFYWNVSTDKFFQKMNTAYNEFWNTARKEQAKQINLSPAEVTVLASIVEKEVVHEKELPTVAGVYLNRLREGMPLQADPTLVFALRDFDAKRVNSKHKEYDSPFNTYLHTGLPPGPICMPRKKSIDAVLNAEQHDYLYFCANPDMSGYSVFSKTYKDQLKIAEEYRKKLDKLGVH